MISAFKCFQQVILPRPFFVWVFIAQDDTAGAYQSHFTDGYGHDGDVVFVIVCPKMIPRYSKIFQIMRAAVALPVAGAIQVPNIFKHTQTYANQRSPARFDRIIMYQLSKYIKIYHYPSLSQYISKHIQTSKIYRAFRAISSPSHTGDRAKDRAPEFYSIIHACEVGESKLQTGVIRCPM